MLVLKGITKDYRAGTTHVEALRGIDIAFRSSEFVAILGPSGCGKTTLLNLIGGLDQYTTGDLQINGKSTKQFRDSDWDAYRNQSVGFVFQNYNLIPHQSVLSNVELAMTLSGVSKQERRKRAIDALEQVGLHDQLKKKPTEMSGGQMQRVAIARALVNNPDILLADEPTGALDSETSVQIMEILKEISKERLIIMVTHNPDLADTYATRIIKVLDGLVTSDSNPCTEAELKATPRKEQRAKKPSLSHKTALSLSLNNLLTKKTRTFMTAFAGSIGIIGIALILSLSSGMTNYIHRVETDTLSTYPLAIQKTAMDLGGLMDMTPDANEEWVQERASRDPNRVYSADVMGRVLSTIMSEVTDNNLKAFKAYLESGVTNINELVSGIRYSYSTPMNIYNVDTPYGIVQVNPSNIMESMGAASGVNSDMMSMYTSSGLMSGGMGQMNVWEEMIDNKDLLSAQYDVLAGRMPENYDEVVIIVTSNNILTDMSLYSLGLKDPADLSRMFTDLMTGKEVTSERTSYSYEDLMNLSFRLMVNTDYYEKTEKGWIDHTDDDAYIAQQLENATQIKVVGILRPSDKAAAQSVSGAVGYTKGLTEYLLSQVNGSEIVKAQMDNPDVDVFTGLPFGSGEQAPVQMPAFDMSLLTEQQQAMMASMTEEQIAAMMEKYAPKATASTATYDENLTKLGVADMSNPSAIYLYPVDFDAKEAISAIIDAYNAQASAVDQIRYTDYIGLLLSSITTIINAISYVLIAFVAISLVVSSIMIGIITYISVLERTKEIGILRAIGASKKDISRVFNAETIIMGFTAGAIGIGVTLLLVLLVNVVITSLTGLVNIAALPWAGAVILILISMLLTFIAGLIPAKIAAKKDPVVALRSE